MHGNGETKLSELKKYKHLLDVMGDLTLNEIRLLEKEDVISIVGPKAAIEYLLLSKEVLDTLGKDANTDSVASLGSSTNAGAPPTSFAPTIPVLTTIVGCTAVKVAYGKAAVVGKQHKAMRPDLIPVDLCVPPFGVTVEVLDLSECFLFDVDLQKVHDIVEKWKPKYLLLRSTRISPRVDKRVLDAILQLVDVVDCTGTTFATIESLDYFSNASATIVRKLVWVRESDLFGKAWHMCCRKAKNILKMQRLAEQTHLKYYSDFNCYYQSICAQ